MALARQGRWQGARAELSQKVLRDIAAVWAERGPSVIRQVAMEDPSTFLRVVTSLIPRELKLEGDSGLSTVAINFLGTRAVIDQHLEQYLTQQGVVLDQGEQEEAEQATDGEED